MGLTSCKPDRETGQMIGVASGAFGSGIIKQGSDKLLNGFAGRAGVVHQEQAVDAERIDRVVQAAIAGQRSRYRTVIQAISEQIKGAQIGYGIGIDRLDVGDRDLQVADLDGLRRRNELNTMAVPRRIPNTPVLMAFIRSPF